MGNYTGVATRLKVKKDAPQGLFNFLDSIYAQIPQSENTTLVGIDSRNMQEAVSTLESMVLCGSAYFDAWEWRVKEESENHWLYESRASCKSPEEDIFEMLLNGIRDYLVLEEGDILLRTIYESGSTETIICYVDGKFLQRDGFEYRIEHFSAYSDSRHPYNWKKEKLSSEEMKVYRMRRHGDEYELPWNVKELDALIEKGKKTLSSKDDWCGFGG